MIVCFRSLLLPDQAYDLRWAVFSMELFEPYDQSLLSEAETVADAFPIRFLEFETEIGCPDCADQGGYFFEISTETFQRNWRVDKARSAVPEFLNGYLNFVDEKLHLIIY